MTKELNTGEPVAWIGKTRGEIHKCEDGKIYPFKAWSQSNIALYSQDYVNQLLGEIDALKSNSESMAQTNAAMGKKLLELQEAQEK